MRRALAVVSAYSALVLAFFAPVVFGDRILAYDDALKHYLPSFTVGPVLWSSSSAGYPIYVDIQNMAFFPPKLLFQSLAGAGVSLRTAYNLFVLAPLVLGAVFTHLYVYLFTRRHAAAAVAAAVFALSSPLLLFVEWPDHGYGAATLPLLVYLLERMRADLSWQTRGSLAAGVALTLLSGYPPMSIFVGLTVVFYAVVRGAGASVGARRYYRTAAAWALCGVGMASIQWLPTALSFVGTVGGNWTLAQFNEGAYRPADYIRLLFPFVTGGGRELYGDVTFGEPARILVYLGVSPLVLGAIGLANARGTGAPRVFWCCAIAYFVALALGDLTPVANLTYQVPIVNVGHEWARLFVVVAFAVALLAGLGTAALADRVESRRVWGPLCLVVCVVAVVLLLLQVSPFTVVPIAAGARLPPGWSFSPFENPAVAVPLMLVVATTVVVALTRRGSAGGRLTAVVVPALVLVDLATFGYAHDWRYSSRPADDVVRRPASLESLRTGLLQTGQRIASYRGDTEDGRLVAKRESRDDRTGLRQEIGRFWGFDTLEYFGKWTTPEFNRLTDQLGGDDLSRGQRALDMLAVRYLLVYAPRENDVPDPSVRRLAEMMLAHPESWRDLGQRGHSRAFENLSALPRAWLVRQSHALDTDAAREAIRSGRLPDGTSFDPRTAVLVDRNPGGGGADVPARGDAQILSRTSGHTRVRVSSSQPSVLVLSDTFHRSWRATIDGAPVDIQRADLVLQAVAVPAGQHLVELRFVPMDFYAGAAISLAALLLGVAGLIASASSRGPTGHRLG